jgi:hypothetical protein
MADKKEEEKHEESAKTDRNAFGSRDGIYTVTVNAAKAEIVGGRGNE